MSAIFVLPIHALNVKYWHSLSDFPLRLRWRSQYYRCRDLLSVKLKVSLKLLALLVLRQKFSSNVNNSFEKMLISYYRNKLKLNLKSLFKVIMLK